MNHRGTETQRRIKNISLLCVSVPLWFIYVLSPAQTNAQSVTLHLRNGDRITGNVVKEETNQITLKTTWFSTVIVPAAEIKARETNVVDGARQPAVPGTSAPTPGTAAVAATTPIKPPPPKHWTGEAQLGVDLLFSERNRQLYSGRLKATYAHSRFRNLLDYQFTYGRTEDVLSDNRMYGSMKSDYDLTRKFYVYNLGGAGYDEIRRIDLHYEVGPGVGYHLIKRTNFVLNIEAGVNYQVEDRADDTRSETVFYRFAEEAAWKINARLSFDEKFEYFPRVERWGQYRFRFESNLRYALVNKFSFIVTVLDQYDSGPPEGIPQNDLQVRSSIGVKF